MEHEGLLAVVVQTILTIGAFYGIVVRNETNSRNLKEEVKDMKNELRELSKVITVQAVQSSRIDNMEKLVTMLQKTIEELRRGTGWVQGQRPSIDGEYP